MSFSSFMSSLFLHRCRRFSTKRQNFQSVRAFHNNKLEYIIWREEYLLNMQIKRRTCLVGSFVGPIFFNCRRRSRARFWENESTFKSYNCTVYICVWLSFYMWNLIYISKSSDERSSFIAASNAEFMKNPRSWKFETREKKKSVFRSPLFSDSTLRPSGAKTASGLAHIGLAYHASWGVRIAYPRSRGGEHILENREPECWGKTMTWFSTFSSLTLRLFILAAISFIPVIIWSNCWLKSFSIW